MRQTRTHPRTKPRRRKVTGSIAMTESPKPSLLSNSTLWKLQTLLTYSELIQLRRELLNHQKISSQAALNILNIVNPQKTANPARPTIPTPHFSNEVSSIVSNETGDKYLGLNKTRTHETLSFWEIETLLKGKAISEMPLSLAIRGNPNILSQPKVAIIGSRHPTYYGREQAHIFARDLAKAGITIVSGGAIGIDTIANQAAFDNGNSCVVLGSGLNRPYPSTNKHMFETFAGSKNGLVLSEFAHDCSPQKWNFPRRNRTIAALADFLLVIEATVTSGSMLTVHAALEMNCDVGAIPGPIDSATSEGTNSLIRDGAFCILKPSDVIERVHAIAAARIRKRTEI